jgi:hypothetical protein
MIQFGVKCVCDASILVTAPRSNVPNEDIRGYLPARQKRQ